MAHLLWLLLRNTSEFQSSEKIKAIIRNEKRKETKKSQLLKNKCALPYGRKEVTWENERLKMMEMTGTL